MRKQILWPFFLFFILLAGCTGEPPVEGEKKQQEEVTIIAPSSKGSSWDITARAIEEILTKKKIVSNPIQVVNIIGAGGEQGWKQVRENRANVLAMNSSLIITNHLLGESQLTYQDFTPIATLAAEWEVVAVAKESTITNTKKLIENLKEDARGYKVGVSPRLGNNDQLSFVLASKKAGLHPEELDYLVYENSSRVVDALLRKEIDVAAMSMSEAKKYYDSGKINILVISSEKRLEELPEIPTWKEEGIDLVFQHWRGIMGPPDMKESEIEYWDEAFANMVKTDEWKQTLNDHHWTSYYKNSRETSHFLKEQSKLYEVLMDVSPRD